jgi:cytochrome c biogenesis protein CcmG/thiol:disulfide interchange protein DsbE
VSRQGSGMEFYGLNYKDKPDDARRWLAQLGDPYKFSLVDFDGKVGIDYGVYGVPETFVIDKQGVIRHKVIGPITPAIMSNCLVPLTQLLQQDATVDAPEMKKVMKACT